MSASDSWKLLVFRDGRSTRCGPELLHGLAQQLRHVLSFSDFHSQTARDEVVEALLRSGELECALADDLACEMQAKAVAGITDEVALALISQRNPQLPGEILGWLAAAKLPERLSVSTPEGFCYYALHPLDYVDLLEESAIDAPAAAVIGIRSIGTTLSAVVRAWFELRGIPAERATVRPIGHPFERTLAFSDAEHKWITHRVEAGAQFLIVDEGPGLSGSSFLAVAEALMEAGVSHTRIKLLPSSTPNFESLLARDALNRWSRFKTLPLKSTRHIPAAGVKDIGWGTWRNRVFSDEQKWPGVWPWTERRKYLSDDGECVFKFEGHGHYGKAVRRRSEMLASAGWGPEASSAGDGFTVSPWVHGSLPMHMDRDIVVQLARYCAFRAAQFHSGLASNAGLEEMTQMNLQRALGISHSVVLPIERPVIADARMMPCEWILTHDARMLKVDATSHGDDHFYPGPTDIAWDLAGAITEWKLDREASELLALEYERISGDAVQARLSNYLIAYAAFRLGFTLSAAQSVGDVNESERFQREAEVYRARLASLLPLATAA